jgi:hypothetical protein
MFIQKYADQQNLSYAFQENQNKLKKSSHKPLAFLFFMKRVLGTPTAFSKEVPWQE